MGYDDLKDVTLVEWARKVHLGTVRVNGAEGEALILEVVRLRKGLRKLDRELMKAQQEGLFADEGGKARRPRFPVPAEA
jgi:hypothetical protein